jgi:hypothetical protein
VFSLSASIIFLCGRVFFPVNQYYFSRWERVFFPVSQYYFSRWEGVFSLSASIIFLEK